MAKKKPRNSSTPQNNTTSAKKRTGAYNRSRGQRAEQKIVNELKALGFEGVVSSRSESKTTDDNKIDIIDKNNQLPCYIQIKHTLQTPQYFSIREESSAPNEKFCIIWDKQKRCATNIVTIGSAVIMDKQLFYKLIQPYTKK